MYSIQINVFVKRIDTIQIVCFLHMIYSYKTCIKFNLFLYIPTPLLMMQLIFLLTLNQQLFCFRDLEYDCVHKTALNLQPSLKNDAKTTQEGMTL